MYVKARMSEAVEPLKTFKSNYFIVLKREKDQREKWLASSYTILMVERDLVVFPLNQVPALYTLLLLIWSSSRCDNSILEADVNLVLDYCLQNSNRKRLH